MGKLPLIWTVHLKDPERKSNFEQLVLNSTQVLDRVRAILDFKLGELEDAEDAPEFYEKRNLDERFYRNQGRKKELRDLLQILTFTKDAKTSG